MDTYQPDFMNPSVREKFLQWYNNGIQQNEIFDFQKEFYDYCKSDVQLLTEGCLNFRSNGIHNSKLNSSDSGVDPFRKTLTIASYSNYIYRRNFLPEKSIGIIPDNGYNPKQKTSHKARSWLKFLEISKNISIQHAESQKGEFKIDNFYVDGYDQVNKTIYEFHGCYW